MKAGSVSRRASRSNNVSSPTSTCSGNLPMRCHSSLVNAIDRAVHDLVGSVGERRMLKNGAEATSQTVHPLASRHDPPSAYSASPATQRGSQILKPIGGIGAAGVGAGNNLRFRSFDTPHCARAKPAQPRISGCRFRRGSPPAANLSLPRLQATPRCRRSNRRRRR